MGLKGKIKSINLVPFELDAVGGSLKRGQLIELSENYDCYYYLFNEFGDKLERRQPYQNFDNAHGNNYYGFKYIYSKTNLLSEAYFYDFNTQCGDYKVRTKFVYIYNSKGEVIIKKVLDENNKLVYKDHYSYDEKGNRIQSLTVPNKSGSQKISKEKKTFFYDNLGNLIRKEDYEHCDSIQTTTSYKYDSNQHLIQKETLDNEKNTVSKRNYVRNDFGDIIEERVHNKLSIINKFKYDDHGNWISKETCWISHIITDYSDYSDFIVAKWMLDSGENPYMGERVLIEREIQYY